MIIAKYVNHLGEELILNQKPTLNYPYIMQTLPFMHRRWNYVSENDKIIDLNRNGVVEFKTTLTILAGNSGECNVYKSLLLGIIDKDVQAQKPGKLYIRSTYIPCYITASDKIYYSPFKKYAQMEITVVTDSFSWVFEDVYNLKPAISPTSSDLDYPYDYEYDFYFPTTKNINIYNHYLSSDFDLIFFGYAVNPEITIGGHKYKVNTTVGGSEYLKISSKDKTIRIIQNDGTEINKFADRDTSSYIFEKIPAGIQKVEWSNNYGAQLKLYVK